jgi:ketosteroid isomerase-like protein
MRKIFLLFNALIAAIAFATSCEQPAGNNANKPANANANATTTTGTVANEAEIKKFLADFGATMSKNDVVVLDKMWADDFMFVSHDGEILTKAQLLEVLRSGTEKFESVTFDDVNVRTYGDTAVVRAHGTQKATLEGKEHSGRTVASIVLVKSKDGWHMVLTHLAELKPAVKSTESNKPNGHLH